MGRISRAQMFMDMARAASRRSTCFRLNVGAIVTQGNNPIAVGWNGQEPGAPHCAGNGCPGIVPGRCGTIHAEVNALVKASTLLGADRWHEGVDLYVTNSPCSGCMEFILEDTPLKVANIFYEVPYRDVSHLGHLKDKLNLYVVTPAGYIVEHFTRQVVELP